MADFVRQGTFGDRDAFLGRLREKLAHLRSGPLAGLQEEWARENGADTAVLSGFGVSVRFTVDQDRWRCEGELPQWLPVSPALIEERFDREFADLTAS